jgi:RNA polymerase sigma factor (sigma-70 family)
MKRFSDEEIIVGLKERDSQTLQYIYKNHYDPVRQLINNNSGSDDDAEDVFQEALIIVFKRLGEDDQFELTSAFKTYIYSVSRLIWLKKLRDQRKMDVSELKREMEEYIEFEEPPPVQDKDLRMAIYQRNLLLIPGDCQNILRMTAENIKSKDIAEKLGFRSESYVRKRRHFCKEFLVNKIKEDAEYRDMFED